MGLYGLYLAEQILSNTAPTLVGEYRLVVLVAVLPLALVVVLWSAIRWHRQRQLLQG
jgi:cation:H+ antiporter